MAEPVVQTSAESPSSFSALKQFLIQRSNAPRGHFTFYAFLVIAVVIFGGFGIWEAMYRNFKAKEWDHGLVTTALYTYFPAIAISSAFELILPENSAKYVRSFALTALAVMIVLAVIAVIMPTGVWSCAVSVAGYMGAICLWWISNAENEAFRDKVPKDAPLGGDPEAEAGGGVSGFKVK